MSEISTVDTSDIPAIFAIEQESFEDPWTQSKISERLARNTESFKAIRIGGEVAGYYYVHTHLSRTTAGEKEQVAEVGSIAVAKKYRGKGIGEFLLKSAIDQLLNESKLRLVLHTRTDNEPMIRLAQKVGFRMTGIIPDFYQESTSDAYEFEYPR